MTRLEQIATALIPVCLGLCLISLTDPSYLETSRPEKNPVSETVQSEPSPAGSVIPETIPSETDGAVISPPTSGEATSLGQPGQQKSFVSKYDSATQDCLYQSPDNAGFQNVKSSCGSDCAVIGHVSMSPEPNKKLFGVKDLVYIKMRPSTSDRINVGDRYGFDPETVSDIGNSSLDCLSHDEEKTAGEVEIICVGEHTALGIILKAHSSIIQGVGVRRLKSPGPFHS